MVLIPAGRFQDGQRQRQGRRNAGPRDRNRRVPDGPLRDDAGQLRQVGPDQRIALQGPRPAGGDDQLGRRRALLQQAVARRKGSIRATTKRAARATSPPTATACLPRPNGNMPAAPARPATTASARTAGSSRNMPGLPTTRTSKRTRSARRSRMPGACTTCTATWPNGATTFTRRAIPRTARRATPTVPTDGPRRVLRGGAWNSRGRRLPLGLPRGRKPRFAGCLLSPATRSASAACGGATENPPKK